MERRRCARARRAAIDPLPEALKAGMAAALPARHDARVDQDRAVHWTSPKGGIACCVEGQHFVTLGIRQTNKPYGWYRFC